MLFPETRNDHKIAVTYIFLLYAFLYWCFTSFYNLNKYKQIRPHILVAHSNLSRLTLNSLLFPPSVDYNDDVMNA